MQQRSLGRTGIQVSEITLGGGGIGMVWGETTEEECIETVKHAVASGINILDLAPMYGKGKAEEIVGKAWPELSMRPLIATKVFVRPKERADLAGTIRRSLTESLNRLGVDRVDIFQLHNQIEPQAGPSAPLAPFRLTPQEMLRVDGVLDTMQKLKEEGLTRAIGFTGIARQDVIRELFSDDRLETVQLVTNMLDSEGEMGAPGDGQYQNHLEMVSLAHRRQIGVFGIRPFAAGSLTDAIDRVLPDDHPVVVDFARARQHFGFLRPLGSRAQVAMRYALSVPGVSTVVTGAKNRAELRAAIAAAEAGPLPVAMMERIAKIVHHLP